MQHPYSLALSLSKERELKGLAENRFWMQAILQPLPWHDAYLDLKETQVWYEIWLFDVYVF